MKYKTLPLAVDLCTYVLAGLSIHTIRTSFARLHDVINHCLPLRFSFMSVIRSLVFHGIWNMKNIKYLICTSVKGVHMPTTSMMIKELEVSALFHLSFESFFSFDPSFFPFYMSMQRTIFGEATISFILL